MAASIKPPIPKDLLEAIEGRKALFAVNRESRKMRGMISEGMLFDLGYEDGIRPAVAVPEHPVPDGIRAA